MSNSLSLDKSNLTKSQLKVFNKIIAFLANPNERFFRLNGYAGTGKTYLLSVLASSISLAQAATAPTNDATKVFASKLPETCTCKTIYSLLGIRMVADEDRLVLEFPYRVADLNRWNIIYIDEGSMLPENLVEYIIKISVYFPNLKWIISADRAQLPPVGEIESMIWAVGMVSASLTEVVRHDNQILTFATHVRNQIRRYPNAKLRFKNDHSNKEGVWVKDEAWFLDRLATASKAGLFHEVKHTKAVAWRNKTVRHLNDLVRFNVYGQEAYDKPWIIGDRISVADPVKIDGKIVANISDEGTVTSVKINYDSFYKSFKRYQVVLKMDYGSSITVSVIHEDSEVELANKLSELADIAKADNKKWGAFWLLKESFHKLRHSFAGTAHRVQGQTLKNVFVDKGDILENRNELEALKCLYVAATRPTDVLILT